MPMTFGDSTPEDAYSAGDDEVHWARVGEVAAQVAFIDGLTDPAERLGAAKFWAWELSR